MERPWWCDADGHLPVSCAPTRFTREAGGAASDYVFAESPVCAASKKVTPSIEDPIVARPPLKDPGVSTPMPQAEAGAVAPPMATSKTPFPFFSSCAVPGRLGPSTMLRLQPSKAPPASDSSDSRNTPPPALQAPLRARLTTPATPQTCANGALDQGSSPSSEQGQCFLSTLRPIKTSVGVPKPQLLPPPPASLPRMPSISSDTTLLSPLSLLFGSTPTFQESHDLAMSLSSPMFAHMHSFPAAWPAPAVPPAAWPAPAVPPAAWPAHAVPPAAWPAPAVPPAAWHAPAAPPAAWPAPAAPPAAWPAPAVPPAAWPATMVPTAPPNQGRASAAPQAMHHPLSASQQAIAIPPPSSMGGGSHLHDSVQMPATTIGSSGLSLMQQRLSALTQPPHGLAPVPALKLTHMGMGPDLGTRMQHRGCDSLAQLLATSTADRHPAGYGHVRGNSTDPPPVLLSMSMPLHMPRLPDRSMSSLVLGGHSVIMMKQQRASAGPPSNRRQARGVHPPPAEPYQALPIPSASTDTCGLEGPPLPVVLQKHPAAAGSPVPVMWQGQQQKRGHHSALCPATVEDALPVSADAVLSGTPSEDAGYSAQGQGGRGAEAAQEEQVSLETDSDVGVPRPKRQRSVPVPSDEGVEAGGWGVRGASKLPGTTCRNCGSQQTPQWRCGPEGPRTLCNACGVRYKKGMPLPYWEKKMAEQGV